MGSSGLHSEDIREESFRSPEESLSNLCSHDIET